LVSFRFVTVRSTSADGELISGDYCHAEAFRASCNDDDDEAADSNDATVTAGPQSISAVSGSTITHILGHDLRVIVIEKALYGRMELGRCVEVDVMGHLGCHTDVLSLVDRRCSGRRRCEIRVPDAELESTRPCLRELKTYLHVSYRCVSG
jgi:Galactose binding lectin domain